jgi:hypothetical protein
MTDDIRNVTITYYAQTRFARFSNRPAERISWTVRCQLSRKQDENGPGYMLQSRKTGLAGGIVADGCYWPLSSLTCISWEVADSNAPSQ